MTEAVFTRGNTLHHVLAMTGASAMGLIAMFGVDLVDMFFLTLLGEQELAAAVGFAGTLLFFLVAVSIGLQIAMGALVARSIGAKRRDLAGSFCTSSLLFNTFVSAVISGVAWIYVGDLLSVLGAAGKTLDYATSYATILLPSMPLMVFGMSAAAGVRAVGDARRSMWATLAGSAVNALLDPLFIFTFDLGLEGAAMASVVSRVATLVVAWHALVHVHRLPTRIDLTAFIRDLKAIMRLALPAVLTNLATPIGSSFVLMSMAQFGDDAVAGAAIMGRVTPLAFAAVFALSSAVGPIIGQNAGAGRYDRVASTLINAVLFGAVYVLVMWLGLWWGADYLVSFFSASEQAADLMVFYCHWLVGAFVFNAALFIANASFNNLHRPHWATMFNFGKTLLGTFPAVYFGAQWYGAKGVMAGEALSAILFGAVALTSAISLVRRLESQHTFIAQGSAVQSDEV